MIANTVIDKLTYKFLNSVSLINDEEFDIIYPSHIYNISDIHWTPVEIAVKAASLLVDKPGTRVLDIGSGAGKFCLIGALTTPGYFTGVEYRKSMVNLSTKIINEFNLDNIEIIHSNIIDIDFAEYDSFYFFNAFYENIFDEGIAIGNMRIDSSVELSASLYKKYTDELYKKLAKLESGKKIVTYSGLDNQIPDCYQLKYVDVYSNLKLWVKD